MDTEREQMLEEFEQENRRLREILQISVLYDHKELEGEIEKALQMEEQDLHEREGEKVEIENERVMNMVEEVLLLEKDRENDNFAKVLEQ